MRGDPNFTEVKAHVAKCCGVPEIKKRGKVKLVFTDELGVNDLADAEWFEASGKKKAWGLIRVSNKEWKQLDYVQKWELLVHELAHLCVVLATPVGYDYPDHGVEWRSRMLACGILEPRACLDV